MNGVFLDGEMAEVISKATAGLSRTLREMRSVGSNTYQVAFGDIELKWSNGKGTVGKIRQKEDGSFYAVLDPDWTSTLEDEGEEFETAS